jgi:3' terminal RNA ribose 2'-O-methyltransferase Hen1
MLLTLTTTAAPATDFGYVLHKNPARAQSFELSFGTGHVFYPVADEERCTVALLVEIDPIGLVRNRRGPGGEGRTLAQYVNDRPYAASSLLAVAIRDAFSTALAGRCKERPELAEREWPLEARISSLPCRGGESLLRRLFEPLGYTVEATQHPLDEQTPDWGASRYFTVTLRATKLVAELLTHLYVLIPVLDDDKHYWVGDDEVDKLVRRGEGWLSLHPERDLIARRYLRHQRSLVRDALEQLLAEELPEAEAVERGRAEEEESLERQLSLNEQRISAVRSALQQTGARRVLDLGCGEGRLLRALAKEHAFDEIVGLDVSPRALEIARDRLKLDELPERVRERVKLMHGSLLYRDQRLAGFDAAAVVEVIEHLDPPRLAAFERTVFEFARPGAVVVTTPNREYNATFATLPAGQFRHKDHRFEWSRGEFAAWANGIATRFGYSVRFLPIGPEDPQLGAPTQMAVFSR